MEHTQKLYERQKFMSTLTNALLSEQGWQIYNIKQVFYVGFTSIDCTQNCEVKQNRLLLYASKTALTYCYPPKVSPFDIALVKHGK